ncbi:unnamed protein product [Prorocentrum cordatum]|nr:unnamed protein product [Polarella glacialis]
MTSPARTWGQTWRATTPRTTTSAASGGPPGARRRRCRAPATSCMSSRGPARPPRRGPTAAPSGSPASATSSSSRPTASPPRQPATRQSHSHSGDARAEKSCSLSSVWRAFSGHTARETLDCKTSVLDVQVGRAPPRRTHTHYSLLSSRAPLRTTSPRQPRSPPTRRSAGCWRCGASAPPPPPRRPPPARASAPARRPSCPARGC